MSITSEGKFSHYGKAFQEKIVQCLLTDKQWAAQMSEVMTDNYFDLKYLQYLSKKYFSYYNRYKDFPTLPLLITIIRDDLKEGISCVLSTKIQDTKFT